MKSYTTYILFSASIQRYYIGSTSMNMADRLLRHNSNHKGYTGKADDWKVAYVEVFENVSSSRKLEIKIKKRGAERYLIDMDG